VFCPSVNSKPIKIIILSYSILWNEKKPLIFINAVTQTGQIDIGFYYTPLVTVSTNHTDAI